MTADIESIKKQALEMVEGSQESLTPAALRSTLTKRFGLKRGEAKSVIHQLVAEGHLSYSDRHGRTIIEPSFFRPVRLSKHVILTPPELSPDSKPGDVVVRVGHGVSFGSGQHPTTRLSVRGIDYAISEMKLPDSDRPTAVLDIGTGSGVLAIVAMGLGIEKGIGLDIDPCALSEARANASVNGLECRLEIGNKPLEELNSPFALITANLRFPTLKTLYPQIVRLTARGGALVLSGIKSDELPKLVDFYTRQHFECKWRETEKDWAAAVFLKRADKNMEK